jgi:hypothetical protein
MSLRLNLLICYSPTPAFDSRIIQRPWRELTINGAIARVISLGSISKTRVDGFSWQAINRPVDRASLSPPEPDAFAPAVAVKL